MSSRTAAIVGAFLLPAIVLAQAPDFSGEWMRESSRRFYGMTGYGLDVTEVPSAVLVIKQDGEVLNVEERGTHGVARLKHGLSGQMIVQPVDGRIAPATARLKSRWQGAKLVTAIEVTAEGLQHKLEQVRYLRSDDAMVVEMKTIENGRSVPAWQAVYRRVSR